MKRADRWFTLVIWLIYALALIWMPYIVHGATLMQPGDFTGLWSFQSRIVPRVSVVWGELGPGGERIGRSKLGETVVAFRAQQVPLAIGVIDADTCMMFVPTRASRNHRHLRGRLYVADPSCELLLDSAPFRAHQRRP